MVSSFLHVGAALGVVLSSAALAYEARVVEVHSGHQLVVMAGERRVAVRLAGIEAPTGRARYAIASRQSLIALCGGEAVQVEGGAARESGKEQRAAVTCNGLNAAAEQLRRGMATLERGTVHPELLQQGEAAARAARRGVWAPVPDPAAGR